MPSAAEIAEAVEAVRAVLDRSDGDKRVEAPVASEVLSAYTEELAAWAIGEAHQSALLGCWASESSN